MSSEWLTQTLAGDHRPLRALQPVRGGKKVPGIPHPRGKAGVPDNFIKESCSCSYTRCISLNTFLRSSIVNAHTVSADTHV